MCQLLGMNCNTPTDIGFSFAGFQQRGGKTDQHTDGFGIAFFEQKVVEQDLTASKSAVSKSIVSRQAVSEPTASRAKVGLRLYHDDKPSYNSPVAELIRSHPVKAMNVIAHIRKATQGTNSLENTHPFVREVWGEQWAFAHNGQMNIRFVEQCRRLAKNGNSDHYQPVGTTDSELAFCYLLNRLRTSFKSRPDDATLFQFLVSQCRYLAGNGLFNCLLSNGDWHLAYAGSLLFHLTRKAPFGKANLSDEQVSINFADHTTDKDCVTVMVTVPLTDNEEWQQLAVNECVIFRDGELILQDLPSQKTYLTVAEGIAIAKKVGASV